MIRKIIKWIIILLLVIKTSYAQDPFDASRRQNIAIPKEESELSNVSATKKLKNCDIETLRGKVPILQDYALKKLKIIGIVNYKAHQQLLISDPEQAVYPLNIGDFVGEEQLEVVEIGNREVKFRQLMEDCQESKILNIHF